MIDRESGAFYFHGGRIGPETLPEELRGAATPTDPSILLLEAVDLRDRPLTIAARVVSGRVSSLSLTYAIRRPAEHVLGDADPWEVARKDYQDAIVREWFMRDVHDLIYGVGPQPGPVVFRFDWGEVRSDIFATGARVEVRYSSAEA